MSDSLVKLQELFEREEFGQDKPLPLPWSRLNFSLGGGLRPGTLSLLVGEPGSAKSFLALEICLFAHRQGWRWCYSPLERDDTYATRRLLAVLLNKWAVLDPEESRDNSTLLDNDDIFAQMARMTPNIEPNPHQLRQDAEGFYYVPRCEYRGILERMRQLCFDRDLVVLDPLSMLSFDDAGRDVWHGQESFIKDATATQGASRSPA